ncbi:hypothetical protein [Eggerthella guodeyinii]|uniref:hypothetical protein n=1 Tax=Eggerthella guodeyinii TaxID=2690837 RepID=UPI001C555EFE|nr:hypothetical protein [Eggerthella guodeyinii]
MTALICSLRSTLSATMLLETMSPAGASPSSRPACAPPDAIMLDRSNVSFSSSMGYDPMVSVSSWEM